MTRELLVEGGATGWAAVVGGWKCGQDSTLSVSQTPDPLR